jgi:cytochrome c-type biogenesis protein CcsB
MLSFAWGAAVVYLALERMTKNRSLGSFVVPLIALFALLACRIPSEVNPTMPALKSAWRIPHIASGILAYAAFGIAFGISIMYLIRDRAERKGKSFWTTRLPSLEAIDRITYRTVAFGFMLQTLLLITGAIWAQYAWGRYWGWDPKETWGLVTWLIYAAYLHTRAIGWRGRKSAVVAIVGFIATIFTLLGVSFLMSGLHSYM